MTDRCLIDLLHCTLKGDREGQEKVSAPLMARGTWPSIEALIAVLPFFQHLPAVDYLQGVVVAYAATQCRIILPMCDFGTATPHFLDFLARRRGVQDKAVEEVYNLPRHSLESAIPFFEECCSKSPDPAPSGSF